MWPYVAPIGRHGIWITVRYFFVLGISYRTTISSVVGGLWWLYDLAHSSPKTSISSMYISRHYLWHLKCVHDKSAFRHSAVDVQILLARWNSENTVVHWESWGYFLYSLLLAGSCLNRLVSCTYVESTKDKSIKILIAGNSRTIWNYRMLGGWYTCIEM